MGLRTYDSFGRCEEDVIQRKGAVPWLPSPCTEDIADLPRADSVAVSGHPGEFSEDVQGVVHVPLASPHLQLGPPRDDLRLEPLLQRPKIRLVVPQEKNRVTAFQ
jgi:hypothetical protein